MKYADPLAQAEIDRLRAKIARFEELAHEWLDDMDFDVAAIRLLDALADPEGAS